MQCSAHKQSVRNSNIRYQQTLSDLTKNIKTYTIIRPCSYAINNNTTKFKIKHADIKLNAITYKIKEIHL